MGSEQRRFPRITQSLDARYRTAGGFSESWQSVRTVDLSATGMRVRSEQLLELMVTLELRLQVPGLRQPMEVRGQVVRSQMLPSGVTEAGIDFLEMSLEQQQQVDELVRFLKRGEGPAAEHA